MAILRLLTSLQVLVIQKPHKDKHFHAFIKELILSIPLEYLKPLKQIIIRPPLDEPYLTEEIIDPSIIINTESP